jgi:hypothetical protein
MNSTVNILTDNPSTVGVTLKDRHVLFVAPDNELTRRWGVYGRPDMYQADDGSIIASDHGDMDTYDREVGTFVEAVAYRSTDKGQSWEPVDFEKYGHTSKVFDLEDGSQVRFLEKFGRVDLLAAGVEPIGRVISPNEYALCGIFRYGDLPDEARVFEVCYRDAGSDEFTVSDARIEAPDLRLIAALKAKKGDAIWPDVRPLRSALDHGFTGLHQGCTGQEGMVEAADGTWLAAVTHAAPIEHDAHLFHHLVCIASQDKGRTWRLRGNIYDQRELTTFGATEEYSMIRLGDEIICAVRSDICSRNPYDQTLLSRSTDSGMTWSTPVQAAQSSVTPHLLKLENGVVALTHGRPGVHVQFSTDGCRSWNTLTSIIGKTKEEELAAGRDLMQAKYSDSVSYSNTRTVVTGPDRFLILYTDFRYEGEKRKAIVVQEVVVTGI